MWFSLAAYNVGWGHVRDPQRIANARGLRPDRWFDNVERAMLQKERPEIHEQTRFGYARGHEPVAYVRDIRRRYQAYLHANHGETARLP
jgi:membrane-bound lytic murein transglycosylase F